MPGIPRVRQDPSRDLTCRAPRGVQNSAEPLSSSRPDPLFEPPPELPAVEPLGSAEETPDPVSDPGKGLGLAVKGALAVGLASLLPAAIALLVLDRSGRSEAIAAAVIATVGLAILAYLLLARRWARPLGSLTDTAAQLRDGHLSARVEIERSDELGRLASSLDGMAERLDESAAKIRVDVEELRSSLALTKTILGTVDEGLLLIRPDLTIEVEHSTAAETMFDRDHLAGADFLALVREIVPEQLHAATERFLHLVFDGARSDEVLARVNPLREVEVAAVEGDDEKGRRYLSFAFKRVWHEGAVDHVMVIVSDATSRVLLARELADSERRTERQADLLLSVMHVQPDMLRDFIEGAHRELQAVSAQLREDPPADRAPVERETRYRNQLAEIARAVQSIRGAASMIGIEYFETKAGELEERLIALRERAALSASDFVPVVLELSEMLEGLSEVRELIGRFRAVHASMRGLLARSDIDLLSNLVQGFVRQLGEQHDKKATVRFQTAEDLRISFRQKAALRDVLEQLTENAIVHGIETPTERRAAGKPEHGSIDVAVRRSGDRLELLFRDDGRGIEYRKIVERAREMVKVERDLLDELIDREKSTWKADALNQLVFHPGFTAADPTSDGGDGLGLSAVRERVIRLGGTIDMRQKPGQYLEVLLSLPQ